MKTWKIILLSLLFTACGNTQRFIERELDPDTLAAITKLNMGGLQGHWIAQVTKTGVIEINVAGDTFEMNIIDNDQPLGYSSSTIRHLAPGKIALISDSGLCKPKGSEEGFEFKVQDQDTLITPATDPKLTFKRSTASFIPLTHLCLDSSR
ncbi:MAG: hypothetical protein EOP04_00870 [Proteobacteria bacterium]|nr:MAG: hypothetical protein EOP04_00870 [Pseudomonadota bacterium]